jgi:hypothetical protein
MAKTFNLIITEDDKNNLISILNTCTIKGSDALYILGLSKRIQEAEEIQPETPEAPEVPRDNTKDVTCS